MFSPQNSDDEEQLLLDDEDLEFLENDLDYVESNDNVDKIEVVIEPPAGNDMNTEKPNDLQKASFSVSTPAQEEPSFEWTKTLPQSSTIDSSNHNAPDTRSKSEGRGPKASKSNNFCQNFTFLSIDEKIKWGRLRSLTPPPPFHDATDHKNFY